MLSKDFFITSKLCVLFAHFTLSSFLPQRSQRDAEFRRGKIKLVSFEDDLYRFSLRNFAFTLGLWRLIDLTAEIAADTQRIDSLFQPIIHRPNRPFT